MTEEGELPEGWTSEPLSELCDINPPKLRPDALSPADPVSFVPMPAVNAKSGSIEGPLVRRFSEVRRGFTSFRDGDVILAKITPCMENGKAAIAKDLVNGVGFGSTEFHVLRSQGRIDPAYLHLFIRQGSFRRAAQAEMTGSVGQKRLPVEYLRSAEIPLPPLAEQKRIVPTVEELLNSVTASRERLSPALVKMKRFRQAVIAVACSGTLTDNLRSLPLDSLPLVSRSNSRADSSEDVDATKHLNLPKTWTWVQFGTLAKSIRMGTTVPPMTEPTPFPVLRSSSVRPGSIDVSDVKYLRAKDSTKAENFVEDGDLLFTRLSGSLEYVANCAQVKNLQGLRLQYPDRLFRARLRDPSLGPYLELCFRSPFLRRALEIHSKSSAGHQRVSMSAITGFSIPLPPSDEVQETVRRVESLMVLVDGVEKRVASATALADKLTQAILARAFRGELVPTEAELARRRAAADPSPRRKPAASAAASRRRPR